MALRNGTQWKPTEDVARGAGGAVVAESGQGGGTGHCDDFRSVGAVSLLYYTVPARAAGLDFVT